MEDHITVVKQLKEIFPGIHEDFLFGLCEGYTGDELDMDELVNLVLSLQSSMSENIVQVVDNQLVSNNQLPYPDQIVFEPDKVTALPFIDAAKHTPVENSRLVTRSPACETKPVQGILIEAGVNEQVKNNQEYVMCRNDGQKQVSCDVKQSVGSLENKTSASGVANQIDKEINEVNLPESQKEMQDPVENCEEELSAEFYIRYLWVEDGDCTDASQVCEITSLGFEDSSDVEGTFHKANNSKTPRGKFSKNDVDSDKLTVNMPENSTRVDSNGQPTRPLVWQRSFDSTLENKSTSRQATFRSSKAKTNEWRLRKLVRQKKLSLRMKTVKEHKAASSQSQFENEDIRFSFLTKVLPDADREFLLTESQRISSQEELLTFVSQSLDARNYPRLKPEETNKMERFECTVEEFLLGIPDPHKEFSSDKYIRTGYEKNAEIYLKSRYKNLGPAIIEEMCINNKYNLINICQMLDALGLEVRPYGLDNVELHHSPSVFFHQEVWFIEHQKEVQNVLDSAIQAAIVEAELNPPVAPQVEEVFECEICRDDVVDYTELATCDGLTGHLFCKPCVKRSAEIKFAEGETKFPCLITCGGFIPIPTIREVLTTKMFEKLMDNIQEAEIMQANMAGAEYCPFCHYVIICPEGDLFCCDRPSCMKKSCRICLKEDHHPERCDMFKAQDEEAGQHYIENKMSDALIRQCYKCRLPFVKIIGCNKMTCRCGAMMCYLCRQPVTDYNHFNGQGGDNNARCPLFSDEALEHERPVAQSAQQAFDELVANNPGINLDREKLIPK